VNIGVKASKAICFYWQVHMLIYDRDLYFLNVLQIVSDTMQIIWRKHDIQRLRMKTFSADIITSALSNPFGVGNSTFRTGSDKIINADTVFGGCYKRDVFDRVGLF